jgi:hypothetical protein
MQRIGKTAAVGDDRVASWAIVASHIQNDAITAWAQRRRLGAEVACLMPNKDGHGVVSHARTGMSAAQRERPGPGRLRSSVPEMIKG